MELGSKEHFILWPKVKSLLVSTNNFKKSRAWPLNPSH